VNTRLKMSCQCESSLSWPREVFLFLGSTIHIAPKYAFLAKSLRRLQPKSQDRSCGVSRSAELASPRHWVAANIIPSCIGTGESSTHHYRFPEAQELPAETQNWLWRTAILFSPNAEQSWNSQLFPEPTFCVLCQHCQNKARNSLRG